MGVGDIRVVAHRAALGLARAVAGPVVFVSLQQRGGGAVANAGEPVQAVVAVGMFRY